MADRRYPDACGGGHCSNLARRLALARSGPDRGDRHDRLGGLEGRLAVGEEECRPGGVGAGRQVHNVLVADVAVGEHHQLDAVCGYQALQFFFGMDRNPVRVQRSGQLRRIAAIVDVGDLRRGERHDAVRGVVAIHRVEVVEVPTGGPQDDDGDGVRCHCHEASDLILRRDSSGGRRAPWLASRPWPRPYRMVS